MTLSPTATSSGTRLPLSSTRPGPIARTSPSWGFSFAVSGMTRPEAVVCSASTALTTMRSSSGVMLTDTELTSPFGNVAGERMVSVRAPNRRRGGRAGARGGDPLRDRQGESIAPISTRSTRVPTPGRRTPAWHDRGVDLAGMRALLTPAGWALLEQLPPYDEGRALALSERLHAEGNDPALVSTALTQTRLRARARDKLGPFADAMLFTPDGLEQATRLSVAAHHARRFIGAGCGRVVDLGCGLGSDAMAFAALDLGVLAYDADELTAALAAVNLRHWPDAEVRCADVTAVDLDEVLHPGDGVWVDPARRTGSRGSSRRTFDPEAFSPPYSFVLDVAARVPATGAKLAPGIAHRLLPLDAEAQWVSVTGDVVECALWWRSLARDGVRRSALLLDGAGGVHELTSGGASAAPVGPVGGGVHKPGGPLIPPGLVGGGARQGRGAAP